MTVSSSLSFRRVLLHPNWIGGWRWQLLFSSCWIRKNPDIFCRVVLSVGYRGGQAAAEICQSLDRSLERCLRVRWGVSGCRRLGWGFWSWVKIIYENVVYYRNSFDVFKYKKIRYNKKVNTIRLYKTHVLLFFYTPIVTLSVLKLYMLTLPEIPYFCFISPRAVFISFTHFVLGKIAPDFFVSLFTRKIP